MNITDINIAQAATLDSNEHDVSGYDPDIFFLMEGGKILLRTSFTIDMLHSMVYSKHAPLHGWVQLFPESFQGNAFYLRLLSMANEIRSRGRLEWLYFAGEQK